METETIKPPESIVEVPIKSNKLIGRLVKILTEITRIKKAGTNTHFNYNYVTEADVLDAVRGKLAENGVFVFTSQEEVTDREVRRAKDGQEKISLSTRVKLRHVFSDGETEFEVFSFGESEDTGDKGLYKAVTGAMKYFVSKNFFISTGDDPETGNPEKDGDRKQTQPISNENDFEDTILSVTERTGTSKAGKPYTAYSFFTQDHGEVQTVFETVAKSAKRFVGTGEIVIFSVERKDPRYKPSLKSVSLKEYSEGVAA